MKNLKINLNKFFSVHTDSLDIDFKHLFDNSYCAFHLSFTEHADLTENPCIVLLDVLGDKHVKVFELTTDGWRYLDTKPVSLLGKNVPFLHTLAKPAKVKAFDLAKAERVLVDYYNETGDKISLKLAYLAVTKSCIGVNPVNGISYSLVPQDEVTILDSSVQRIGKFTDGSEEALEFNQYSVSKFVPLSNNNSIFPEDKGNYWVIDMHLKTGKDKSTVTKVKEFAELCNDGWNALAISPNKTFACKISACVEPSITLTDPGTVETSVVIKALPLSDYSEKINTRAELLVNVKSLETCYFLLISPEGKVHGNIGKMGPMFASVVGEDESVMGFYFNVNGASYPAWNFSFTNFDTMVSYYKNKINGFNLEG